MFDVPDNKLPAIKPFTPAQIAGYGLVAFGLISIVVGLAWRQVVPDEMLWSETDAREYTEAAEAAHAATIPHGHEHGDQHHGEGIADPAQVRERFELAEERLERARQIRGNGGRLLAVCGAVLAASGIILLRRDS